MLKRIAVKTLIRFGFCLTWLQWLYRKIQGDIGTWKEFEGALFHSAITADSGPERWDNLRMAFRYEKDGWLDFSKHPLVFLSDAGHDDCDSYALFYEYAFDHFKIPCFRLYVKADNDRGHVVCIAKVKGYHYAFSNWPVILLASDSIEDAAKTISKRMKGGLSYAVKVKRYNIKDYVETEKAQQNREGELMVIPMERPLPAPYNRMYDDAPVILPRSAWDEEGDRPEGRPQHAIRRLVIHHTYRPDRWNGPETIRGIFRHHTRVMLWADIGYHFVVAPDGTIYLARHPHLIGAHCGGRTPAGVERIFSNTGSLGIAAIGDYSEADPPSEQVKGMTHLLFWLSKEYELNPRTDWFGHAENCEPPITACPGRGLMTRMFGKRRADSVFGEQNG